MKIIVACGPSLEPLDEVRRLTNFSTGELGVLICGELARAGHDVICLKGEGATHPGPEKPCEVRSFQTNDDLLALLQQHASTQSIDAVLMVAALCDYKVTSIQDISGTTLRSSKIPSRNGTLQLTLEPATKVMSTLRNLFPQSLLIGWKYELEGTRTEALEKAWRQMKDHRTDLCVLNGRAAGPGFTLCQPSSELEHQADKKGLATCLRQWMEEKTRRAQRGH